jgi:hypothetical protein
VRSRTEYRLALASALLLVTVIVAAAQPRAPLSPTEIDTAVRKGRADPDIGIETRSKRLHWIGNDKPQPPPKSEAPHPWLLNLFQFLGNTLSLIVWILGFIAAGVLGVWFYRVARARAPRVADLTTERPSQIAERGLHRASLPEDIGAAASRLLDAGRIREALSLLYRGALARTAQVHGIPIGESATEGEVLRAVDGRLDAGGVDYLRKLVRLWQRVVYAGAPTAAEVVRPLCADFQEALG